MILTFSALLLSGPGHAATVTVTPGEDWCTAFNAATAGDEILLETGEHLGPCTIDNSGTAADPIVLGAADPDHPPTITYTGTSSNVLDIDASGVTLRGLRFSTTSEDIDAVKVRAGADIIIRDCWFVDIGGIGIAANSEGASYARLHMEGNRFVDQRSTAVYIGCHDGQTSCTATDITFVGNSVWGVSSSGVGYGVQFKLDVTGSIAHNIVRDTQGPGVMVYGQSAGGAPVVVEGNIVDGSETQAAIELGGGPVLVRNNIVRGGPEGGIWAYDYADRGLMDGVHILGNSVLADGQSAIRLSDWAEDADLALQNNAVFQPDAPGEGLPDPVGALPWDGNVACGDLETCWSSASTWDYTPVEDGPLASEAVEAINDELPTDFCGNDRALPGDFAGAIGAATTLPAPLDLSATRADDGCTSGGDAGDEGGSDSGSSGGEAGGEGSGAGAGTDSGGAQDSGVTTDNDSGVYTGPRYSAADKAGELGGCSCQAMGGAAVPLAWVLGTFVLARRRRRPEAGT